MKVSRLNKEQLEDLKHDLFYKFRYNEEEQNNIKQCITKEDSLFLLDVNLNYWDIPDTLICKIYAGVDFANEDFSPPLDYKMI